MSHVTAILDACVLYPAPLRSLFMYLAMTDVFRARWTDTIHEEWMRNIQKDYPDITREKAERIRDLINSHVEHCLVEGYEALIPALNLPDPDDRHVLAAAIRASANVIVTFNLSDFPADVLAPLDIEAWHPDEFITHLLDLAPETVCEAARRRASLKKPPKTVEEYLDALSRVSLPETVIRLRAFTDLI